MAAAGSNPDKRSRFFVAMSITATWVVVVLAVQLAFKVPMEGAIPIAWAAFGIAVLIQVLLVWIKPIVWIVSGLIVALGVEVFSAAIMLRCDMVAVACMSAFVVFVICAFVGSKKQASIRQQLHNE